MNILFDSSVSEMPLVSVIIPTFGRATKLDLAIKSVLNQTYKNIEILIVDDNNPNTEAREETEKVIETFKGTPNIKYIQHKCNLNGSAARNTGIKNSCGSYIAFLDDDDIYLPKKIESQVRCLTNLDNTWGCCYTSYEKHLDDKVFEKNGETRSGELLDEALMRNLFIQAGSNLLVRRSVIEDIGMFDESFLRNQDLEFLVRILRKYKLAYVNTFGLVVTLRKNRTFIDYEQTTKEFIDKFKDDINNSSKKDDIYTMLHIQVFRYYCSRKQFKLAYQYLQEHGVKTSIIINYLCYLIQRKMRKKCYGFSIKK